MDINASKIKRLIELSEKNSGLVAFTWPETLPVESLWCDEDLLTTFGTEIHESLNFQQKCQLSKWEAINFFSLNVHGIKEALKFVADCIYEPRYDEVSEYMHTFIAEENEHMEYFAKFCRMYADKIYKTPSFSMKQDTPPILQELYMFASTLIFEEFVDFYNHKVGNNPLVPPIVRDINHSHHIDESRHVSFGRQVVSALFKEVADSEDIRKQVSTQIKAIINYFVGLMYNRNTYEDADVVSCCGFPSSFAMRNALRNSESRRAVHQVWFRRTIDFFYRNGMIDDDRFLLLPTSSVAELSS